jgi:TonB-linked SusC/RagA family outer membrane protein
MRKIDKFCHHLSHSKRKGGQLIKQLLFSMLLLYSAIGMAQGGKTISGVIVDSEELPVIGATVVVKGTTIGTVTNADGKFSINVPGSAAKTLVISYVGMLTEEVDVSETDFINVILATDITNLEDVIVVGYGQQKKESVVGSITQAKGSQLEKTGGVSNVAAALTGNLPGVITVATRGTPGDEEPKIYIRGQSTWNNSDPLVLVDGIERPMNSVDLGSVESISVLKDASATAVFGVKGANGVILITTKRGHEGKAQIRATVNSTMKIPSRLATKYDSYDALRVRNDVIVRELGLNEAAWEEYTPNGELEKYRNPANAEEAERYPNVDWADVLVKDYAMSYNANINATGGTAFVKYFTSIDFLNEADIIKKIDNGKSYDPAYGYNRINLRNNLDLLLTETTTLSSNLSGSYGVKQDVWGQDAWEYRIWQSIYSAPPDAYLPRYSDGSWGYMEDHEVDAINSAATMGNNGIRKITTTQLYTDFTLKQDLSMVLDGLNAKGTVSFDNVFKSVGGIYEDGGIQQKYVDPVTGEISYTRYLGTNQYNWIPSVWSTRPDETFINQWGGNENSRKLFYQLQLDYAKKFGEHDVTLMGMFSRDKYATGSEFEHFREDWVFRTTYNYSSKYFAEFNGAYNGSEKFGPENRFAFFPSGAVGWMISNEKFLSNLSFLNMLKFRASYGEVGDDNINERWLYMTQWSRSGNSQLGSSAGNTSPYTWWTESKIGNEDIHWEKVTKINFGTDFSIIRGLFAGSVDIFKDHRTDILLEGDERAILSYFGGTPAISNIGEVEVKGYEFELRINKILPNKVRLWANFSMSHARDEIISGDDPLLKDDYLKKEGKQIDQTYSGISNGYYNTWDELYGSTEVNTYDDEKLPGNLNIIDYNGDGIINTYDNVPYGYPERPQNTYNATVGFEWRGISAFIQFYGVNNANRYVSLQSFSGHLNRVYDLGTFWTPENTDADGPMPRWNTHNDYMGTTFLYDGSYVRLKNAEISYEFGEKFFTKIGISALRVYVNGNNLLLWTKMPDDREVNEDASTAYPTVRRVNFGLNLTL